MRVVEQDSREAVIETHWPFRMIVRCGGQTSFNKIPPRFAQRRITRAEEVVQCRSKRPAKRCNRGRTGRKRR